MGEPKKFNFSFNLKPSTSANTSAQSDGKEQAKSKLNFNLQIPKYNKQAENKPSDSPSKPEADSKLKTNGWGLPPSGNLGKSLTLGLQKKDSPAAVTIEFHFGTGQKFQSTKDPKEKFETENSFGRSQGANNSSSTQDNEVADDAEDYEKVSENTIQGEENETILINEKCLVKILAPVSQDNKDNKDQKPPAKDQNSVAQEWKQLGVGPFHLNKCDGFHRIIIRREPLLNITFNCRVAAFMKPTLLKKSVKLLLLMDNEKNEQVPTITVLSFKTPEIAANVCNKLNEIVQSLEKSK